MRDIKYIFVHCTAGPQYQSVQEIQNYWKKHNKWKNPGYHYIIKANGEIVKLLDESKASNGVAGYNAKSINVCYIGGVDKQGKPLDNRTEYQKESLIYILKDIKKRYPNAIIMGHREIWGTDSKKWKKWCPCFNAGEEYKHLMDPEKPKEEPVEVPKPEEPINTPQEPEKPVEQPQNKPERPSVRPKPVPKGYKPKNTSILEKILSIFKR